MEFTEIVIQMLTAAITIISGCALGCGLAGRFSSLIDHIAESKASLLTWITGVLLLALASFLVVVT